MDNLTSLEKAVDNLNTNIQNFSVGAVTLDDFRPIDDKIRNIRKIVKHSNCRIIMLKVQNDSQKTTEVPKENIEDTCSMLYEATAQSIINQKAMELCLYSKTLSDILSHQLSPEMHDQIYQYMKKLCALNDNLLTLHSVIQEAFKKQLSLKIQCQKAIFDYHAFLKEEDRKRQEVLKETNPEIVRNKEKLMKSIKKINIIKRLITNLIASSGTLLKKEPFLEDMLEKHCELINEDILTDLAENGSAS